MGFFSSKPVVYEIEFKKALSELYSRGFGRREIAEVEKLFMGHMESENSQERGIDAAEIAKTIQWLRDNPSKHYFKPDRVDAIEEVLKKWL